MLFNIAIPIFIFIVAAYFGYFLRKHIAGKKLKSAESEAEHILEEANKEVLNKRREVELEAKDYLYRMRQDFERETKDRKQEMFNLEKKLSLKEENVDRRIDLLEKKERDLDQRRDGLKKQEEGLRVKDSQLLALVAEEKERLQKISSLSAEEAKQI